jgi:amino acid adenylation domain-containing protein
VEAAVAEQRGVREAHVIAHEDDVGDKRLVCYLVARGEGAPTMREVREYVQRRLPSYMIPSSFIFLDELPLTVNGKVDRKALPAPDASRPALEQNYVEPTRPLEMLLAQMWREILGLEKAGLHDNFFELGGNSIKGAIFINHLQERIGEIIHVVTIFTSPTIAQLAAYLEEHYSEAVAGIVGSETGKVSGSETEHDRSGMLARVSVEMIEQVRLLVRPLSPREKGPKSGLKNPPAIFILSPPRSGSTLLRVMLAGHPALFAPPELELLSFNTLRERAETFSGAQSFWLEGALRAVMEARGCGADEARRLMQEFEESGWSTQKFYRQLQAWLGNRRLVDKTPSYALESSILRRAEEDFEHPLYIHLLRHPYGMIHSFEEAKMDQLFLGVGHTFSTRELAEIVWNISHQNILDFLQDVPRERQQRLSFEELVTRPEEALESLCHFLGLELHPDMLEPYREKEKRMTDGLYKESRMLGDVKFHQHRSINSGVADRWAEKYTEDFLCDVSKKLASRLGYTVSEITRAQDAPTARSKQQARTVSTDNVLRTIPRRAPDTASPIPLSFTQQGLFFLDQVLLHKSAYNIPLALRIHGTLDVEALMRSLHEIVRRHESLRTSFPVIDGAPAQQIAQKVFVPLLMMDLREFAKGEREDRLRQIATDDARLPFELKRGPLLRATLLQLDEDEHVLIVNMHHIVSDGWSIGIFGHELATLYDAFVAGRKSPLAELPVQYADFAIWQREWLSGSHLEAQLDYWKQQLAGAPLLQLPTDRARPPVQTFRGGDYASSLSEELSQELQELSRREGVTLFMTLLAGFKLLLSRYAGQPDIVVGTPIAGRNRSEIEGLIGFFVNTLVLRTDLSGNPSFRELLGRVQETALGAYAHQDVPFDKLVHELQLPRDQSRTPLFQVMFALANAPRPETKISTGLRLSAVEIQGGEAKFDLTVVVRETNQGVNLAFEYNTDLFDAETIERMMRHLEILLTGIVAEPGKRIDELTILTAEEQRQTRSAGQSQLVEGAFPEARLQQLFEAQAGRTPDAVALIFEDERVSYRELNERANQLAHYLQTLGVGPDVLVAVCLERSVEMVLALLGVLKAGGAYVPLDPAYPQERLAFMLEDCRAQVLITQQHLREKLPHSTAEMLCLDSGWQTIALESRETPQAKVTPANLAYVIYTSGSTGKPKGAMNTHEAICNRLLWMQAAYGLDESDAVLQKTPFSFDVSVWEFFWPLLAGARLVIARPGGHQDASYLVETIRRTSITTMHFVPSMLQAFLEERELEHCRSLRRVICSGETLSFELQEKFFARVDAELHNLYGPTEAAVDVTNWRCERGSARTLVPIGRAIANTEVYVLDRSLNPLPVGVAGEIYIGGVALARGYLRRAELTAERFIPHPFSPSAGGRLYRTGDLGRRLAGGEIDFLGRLDHQVKLRGFRIELGEIEAVLGQHADVEEAVVVAREELPGDKRLVAYLLEKKGAAPRVEELRSYLKSKLPDYMMPSAYVKLDELPLMPNGKVDRQALPAPDVLRSEDSSSRFIAPRNELELQLVQIWEEVLNVKPVGVRDNFFDLGGHSLLAVKLFSRIEQATGATLSMTTIFDNATVEQQAVLLVKPRPASRVSSLVPIQPQGHRPPLFCVHPWGGNVLCYSELAKHLGLDQPVYGLQARGVEKKENPQTSIEAMAADYLTEIRGLQPEGPYHLCGWSSGGLIAFELARQLEEQGQSVGFLALIDAYDLTELYTRARIDESNASQRAARFVSEAQIVTGTGETVFALVHYDEQLGLTYKAPPGLGLVQSRNALDDYVNYYLYVERAMKSYVPRPFNGRAAHFWTASRLALSTPETKRIWSSLCAGGLAIHEVPGEHFTMLGQPHVQTLAGHLKKYLEHEASVAHES